MSLGRVGQLERRSGNFEIARDHYAESLAIRKGLVEQDPSNAQWRSGLALGHLSMGDVEEKLGNLEEALVEAGPVVKAGIDRLIERGRAETDPESRHAVYRQIGQVLAREARLLPLFHEQVYRFARPEVDGLSVSYCFAYEELGVRDPAAPLLRELADYARESVYLTIKDGDHALYIYAVESPQRLLARTAVGDRVPLHCTSVGKAMLAFLTEQELEEIVGSVGLPTFTENTLDHIEALAEELARTRQRGYSLDREEHEVKTFCIGAPIFDRTGQVIAACSISGSSPAIVLDRLNDLSAQVVHTAQEISRRMGFVPTRVSSLRSSMIEAR